MAENKKNYDYSYTQNRELSWLVFNDRVLEEAADMAVPLLERLKFISIFTSNLDEFFMIRVGSLWDLSLLKNQHEDNKSGMLPREQLDKIYEAVKPLYQKRDAIYQEVTQALAQYDITPVEIAQLDKKDRKFVQEYFHLNILPVLSPLIIGVHHPCPHFLNKQLYIMASLELSGKKKYGIVPVPPSIPRVLYLPGSNVRYVLAENIVREFLKDVFEKYKVAASVIISVTRNADINPDDEGYEVDEDYRHHMMNILKKRKKLAPVRLEYLGDMPPEILQFLMNQLHLQPYQCYQSHTPLDMSYAFGLSEEMPKLSVDAVTYPSFTPQPAAMLLDNQPVFEQVQKRDVFLNFPYESMDGFLKLIKEASVDPDVISIKIAIYRMAKQGTLLKYLCDAAENNKDVVVIMELRARFDEESNIEWAEILENSGCQILYGFTGYKVHSKICLITRRGNGGMEYYTQIGTGNYNEKTAKIYTDVSLITANREIGKDASTFFKNMAISNLNGEYHHLLVAPVGIKSKILQLINEEIKKAGEGSPARVMFKVNSLTDRDILDKLKEASAAGVEVNMLVRGICCLLPQIEGKTENIHIESIVGRFLEHSRFYCFGIGEDAKVYISSADLMTRNMSKRVEIACPILDPEIKEGILASMEIFRQDTVKARVLTRYGKYAKKEVSGKPRNAQQYFMEQALKATARQTLSKPLKEMEILEEKELQDMALKTEILELKKQLEDTHQQKQDLQKHVEALEQAYKNQEETLQQKYKEQEEAQRQAYHKREEALLWEHRDREAALQQEVEGLRKEVIALEKAVRHGEEERQILEGAARLAEEKRQAQEEAARLAEEERQAQEEAIRRREEEWQAREQAAHRAEETWQAQEAARQAEEEITPQENSQSRGFFARLFGKK